MKEKGNKKSNENMKNIIFIYLLIIKYIIKEGDQKVKKCNKKSHKKLKK